jgi:hypothetical protein
MTDLVQAFLDLEQAYNRSATTARGDAVVVAAEALIADAAPRHRAEEQARVYLFLDRDGRWAIDPLCLDGFDGYPDGPNGRECNCDDRRECRAVVRALAWRDPVGPVELHRMLENELRRLKSEGLS